MLMTIACICNDGLPRFIDGSEHSFQPAGMDVVEILSDVHQVAYTLNAQMEDQGKTLDG